MRERSIRIDNEIGLIDVNDFMKMKAYLNARQAVGDVAQPRLMTIGRQE